MFYLENINNSIYIERILLYGVYIYKAIQLIPYLIGNNL